MRKLGFAGAPMNDGLLKRLSAAFEPELFVNHYGSSEVYTFSIDQDATTKAGSAGRAGINTRLRVVKLDAQSPDDLADSRTRKARSSRTCSATKRSKATGTGPTRTRSRCATAGTSPATPATSTRDGELYVSGRVDDMIISGGENISPVDIESVLSLHPAVDEVAVAGVKDERWGQRVVAFIKRREYVDSECARCMVPRVRPRQLQAPARLRVRRRHSEVAGRQDPAPQAVRGRIPTRRRRPHRPADHTETTKE